MAARSSARMSARAPPARPTGVRTAATIRASRIAGRIPLSTPNSQLPTSTVVMHANPQSHWPWELEVGDWELSEAKLPTELHGQIGARPVQPIVENICADRLAIPGAATDANCFRDANREVRLWFEHGKIIARNDAWWPRLKLWHDSVRRPHTTRTPDAEPDLPPAT